MKPTTPVKSVKAWTLVGATGVLCVGDIYPTRRAAVATIGLSKWYRPIRVRIIPEAEYQRLVKK